jgi:hypothetical protein
VIEDALLGVQQMLERTALHDVMRNSIWLWPACESLHFIGMAMLVGTVGLFDLRLLGFASAVPPGALHRLIPVGVAGFALNVITGFCFLAGFPDQYLFNAAFRVKVTLLLVAGFNVMFFYGRVFPRVSPLAPGDAPPLAARVAGGLSLGAWIGVMAAGRLLTFFRPPH